MGLETDMHWGGSVWGGAQVFHENEHNYEQSKLSLFLFGLTFQVAVIYSMVTVHLQLYF